MADAPVLRADVTNMTLQASRLGNHEHWQRDCLSNPATPPVELNLLLEDKP